ncbi:RIP metalloprotease RseP [Aliiroseovarius sp. PTFE2010]|uniref:RIP metalloprotease RseP n=1 Tax=Aliiroseovarius sp. PTFE2010 TaxID=3417190 RepID=UPI003CFBA33A
MDLGGLLPQFGNLLYTLVAFIVALSVIVTVHELGHYLVGRWSGIKSDVFSLGFGPVLFKRNDKHGTQWQIAALPFGGYVKFKGDGDASSVTVDDSLRNLSPEERRQTMHGAPLWARAATAAAGPVFNFIMSAIVFSLFLFVQGTASDPLTVDELQAMPGVQELQPGDEILAIAGAQTPKLEEFANYVDSLPDESPLPYTVLRDGAEKTVMAPHPMPAIARAISPDSAAIDARMREGDVITAINGQPVGTFNQLRARVAESEGAPLDLTVWRNGDELSLTLTPRRRDLPLPEGGFETRWLIGISGGFFFDPQTETPGLVQTISYGVAQTGQIITSSLSGLYHMIIGSISTCNLRGPIGIAETSGAMASQGIGSFIWFIAVLSTAVGLLNLFPIPVLDGGHLVFYAYEAVFRRQPSEKAYRILMTMGLALILSLMVLGVTNDLFCE